MKPLVSEAPAQNGGKVRRSLSLDILEDKIQEKVSKRKR
jgi:hypothetical protein